MSRPRFRLHHSLAAGDVVVTSGLTRDLHRRFGGEVDIDFVTNQPAVYENNPYLTPLPAGDPSVTDVTLCYQAGLQSSRLGNRHHFLSWFHRDFEEKTGIHVPVTEAKPDLRLTEEEKANPPVKGRYWVLFAGSKSDRPVKQHWPRVYQEVIDNLLPYGVQFVQSGATKRDCYNPRLTGCLDLVGWGWLRDMFRLIYHAEGVLSPISAGMHVAAAFDKPCVVVAGGIECPWWEWYGPDGHFGPDAKPPAVPHRFLHTIGLLDCCSYTGCLKLKLDPGQKLACRNRYESPGERTIPRCLSLITADHIVEAVLSYYEDGTLPPPAMTCPNCNSPLIEIRGKLICQRCGIIETCCDGGRQTC